jgi:hypothetical protein
MRLPIDTSAMTFMAANGPDQVVDFDTRTPRIGNDGKPLFTVPLVVLGADGADVIAVKVSGEPKGVAQGVAVRVVGLVATPWSIGERAGVSFRAERIEPTAGSSRQAS